MSNRVYTYTRIQDLYKADYFKEIAVIPQLTMSREMARNLTKEMRVLKGNTLDFTSFAKRMFPDWNTAAQRFSLIARLNKFLREKIEQAVSKEEKKWLQGVKRNLPGAINNILHLEEAGVHPEDMPRVDRDMILFVEMWKNLEKTEASIQHFREKCQALREVETFEQTVNQVFRFHGSKQIVWHGFQFLTPLQQFIYDCFTRAGYDIYALIQDDPRYPYANEIWNYLYTEKNHYPKKEQWIRQKEQNKSNPLGEILETGNFFQGCNAKIIQYKNILEFVEDIDRLKSEGFYLYCGDDKGANALLKKYFPERYEARNLLAYPVGQFVFALHEMWDEQRQCVVMTEDLLRKCFESGWLTVRGKGSRQFTEELEKILPFFNGCATLPEWSERIEEFTQCRDMEKNVFGKSDPEKRKPETPLSRFGTFSVEEEAGETVLELIKRCMTMAGKLFREGEPVSMEQHRARLDAILSDEDRMSPDLYREEREKIKQIFDVLENTNSQNFTCYPGDLAASMISMMRGKIEENQSQELQTLVFHLFQVEAAPFASGGKVHVCMADATRLPGGGGTFPWPIDEKILRDIQKKDNDCYVENWLDNINLTTMSTRFCLYAAMNNPQVEISWIRQQGGKKYSPSPYVTMLLNQSDIQMKSAEKRQLSLAYVADIESKQFFDQEIEWSDAELPDEEECKLEAGLCPMRYVYGYILDHVTPYRGEFQQKIAIVRLIQILYDLMAENYSMEYIAKQVFMLFPAIRKAEKRQILDDALTGTLPADEKGYTIHEGMAYTRERMNLVFLDRRCYESARMGQKTDGSSKKRGVFFSRRGETGSKNCLFCPHEAYCMKSLFGVDYKDEE